MAPSPRRSTPAWSELSSIKDNQELSDIYHQGAQLVTVLTGPAALLLCFCAGGIVYLWSGNADLAERTAPILSVLTLGAFLNGLMRIPYQLQLAHGWTSLTLKTNIVAVITLVPAIFIIVPRYGAMGAAWLWVLLNASYVLIVPQLMHRKLAIGGKLELVPQGCGITPVRRQSCATGDRDIPAGALSGPLAVVGISDRYRHPGIAHGYTHVRSYLAVPQVSR